MYMDESHKMDENRTSMNFLDDNYKQMYYLDKNIDKSKCMDGTNSKIIMLDENCMYMEESQKMDEIFGSTWSMNELLDIIGNRRIVWMKLSTI